MDKVTCEVCFHHCKLSDGQTGLCKARTCKGGHIVPTGYGELTALAFDPIEKKPLNCFCPGSYVLSVGSFGCNLSCPFCQNSDISCADISISTQSISPSELCNLALTYLSKGNIGIAYTYNEPLICWEFIKDCTKEVHAHGMKNVMVTNGTSEIWVLEELLPYIDAMNIDLKGFTDEFYSFVGGSLEQTKNFIQMAAKHCHVELTTLIIPGMNDSEEAMKNEAAWIKQVSDESGKDMPLHVTRFFPRHRMSGGKATDVKVVYRLAEVAKDFLPKVFIGNC